MSLIRCIVVSTSQYNEAEPTPFPATLIGVEPSIGGGMVDVQSLRTGNKYDLYSDQVVIDHPLEDEAELIYPWTMDEFEQAKKELKERR